MAFYFDVASLKSWPIPRADGEKRRRGDGPGVFLHILTIGQEFTIQMIVSQNSIREIH